MKRFSLDTHPVAEQFHIELIRKASTFRRLQMASSLSKTIYQLAWQGIIERYPHKRDDERLKHFFSLLHHDRDLTQRVIEALKKRRLNEIA